MHLSQLTRYAIFSFLIEVVTSVPLPDVDIATSETPASSPQAIVQNAQDIYTNNTFTALNDSNLKCTRENIGIRRAWDDLAISEREQYINAVKCLTTKPARTSTDLAPGVRSFYDDFVYAHINQSNFMHQSSLLLPWHRQFIWSFEQALRDECGYEGYLPYWAWERHSANQSRSPVFQPGPASFGSNGAYIPHNATNGSTVGVDPPLFIPRPAGTGSGCITDGPFSSMTINLGPVDPATNPPSNLYGLEYNPRCLTRDFYQPISTTNLTYTAIATLLQTKSIEEFHPLLEFTIHPDSHTFLGGEANDFYSSPNDPLFYLLHAQIDRVWSIWQGQDYSTRRDALDGTVTLLNRPPSPKGTLDSVMRMGVPAGGDLRVGVAMDTVGGEYCYIYA